jgi:anaerobic sulfite reductase subunit B
MPKNNYMPFRSKIEAIIKHTEIEHTFRMSYSGPALPGQFFEVSIPKFGEAPISVSGISNGLIDLTIRRVGKVTTELFDCGKNDAFFLRGPYGNGFNVDDYKNRELFIIAGGTGVSPVRGVIEYFASNMNTVKGLSVVVGFKTPKDILFRSDLENWKKLCSLTLTTDNNGGDSQYKQGLVTEYIPQFIAKDIAQAAAIVVGPPAMMRFSVEALLKRGFVESNIWISYERRMCCGLGKCGHCRMNDAYICMDGPVFNYAKARLLAD